LVVNSLLIGGSLGYINMGDIVTTSMSTLLINAGQIYVTSISSTAISSGIGFFSTLSAGTIYAKFVGDGSGLTGISAGLSALPPFLSTTTLSTGLLTASNISTNSLLTNYGFFSTISSGTITARFVGDGSGLTGITAGLSALPPFLSTTILSTGLLTASNISTNSLSTNYGFFSSISSGNIQGKFLGDGSSLSNLTTSSLSLSSGNISISTITLVDTVNSSTGTIVEKNSLLYFNTFVVGGAYAWASQIIKG
jgi:hypothetical protein